MRRSSDPAMAPDIEPELLRHVRRCIDEIRAGRMVILVDDEDRENEGDLVFAAQKVTADHINFMAKHGRGLICLTLTERQVSKLELPMQTWRRAPALGTAFTLSIEARQGVTTGISAADRARTIQVAVDENAGPEDIVAPGHVFPLKARDGGVLVRTGQTEGSVDLARLAGLDPSGVICEIMNDDGSMARMPDLERFAEQHGLLILTIADLIKFRLQTERLVRRVAESELRMDQTGNLWKAIVYGASVTKGQMLALVYGEPTADGTLCRVHKGSTLGDLFSSKAGEGGRNLRESVERIEAEGAGVVVYIPGGLPLENELEAPATALPPQATAPPEPGSLAQRSGGGLREFGLGAQVLRELGLERIRLLTNNPRKLVGIAGYGLEVLDTLPLGS
jgi:3,4-dihydroxy 2-butanone 4-phosphate synthase / GTP cyclohydrolase II